MMRKLSDSKKGVWYEFMTNEGWYSNNLDRNMDIEMAT